MKAGGRPRTQCKGLSSLSPVVTCSLFLQDPFPKGVIPLTAIEMTRSSKDNKFQVITVQRVFVFRTESEGESGQVGLAVAGQVNTGCVSPRLADRFLFPSSSAGHVVLHIAILPEGAAPPGPPTATPSAPTPPYWHARATWTQG